MDFRLIPTDGNKKLIKKEKMIAAGNLTELNLHQKSHIHYQVHFTVGLRCLRNSDVNSFTTPLI